MKVYLTLARWWLLVCLLGGLTASSLTAREYYDDKEIFGTLAKVDSDKKVIKVDRGPDRKALQIKWSSKTQFRDGDKRAEAHNLKLGQRVRVFYSDDKKRTGRDEPVASKIILNPVSTPNDRRYNE